MQQTANMHLGLDAFQTMANKMESGKASKQRHINQVNRTQYSISPTMSNC